MKNTDYLSVGASMRNIDTIINDLDKSDFTGSYREFTKEVARQYGEELKAFLIYSVENNGNPNEVMIL